MPTAAYPALMKIFSSPLRAQSRRAHSFKVAVVALALLASLGVANTASAAKFAASTKSVSKPTPMATAKSKSAASAPAKIGSPCTIAGATITVASKTLTCAKAMSGKLIWSVSTSAAPAIPRGANGGEDGAENHDFNNDPAFAAAMTKYTDCLKSQGVTLPAFGGRRGFGGADDGNPGASTAPTAAPRPTLSAKEQAAMAKCDSLRPAFGRFGGNPPGGAPGNAPSTAPTFGDQGAKGGVPNTPANVAAYIACLNTNGVNVTSLADLQAVDRQSPKIAKALETCRAKRVNTTPPNGVRPTPTKSN